MLDLYTGNRSRPKGNLIVHRSVQFTAVGSPDVLHLVEKPVPTPGRNDVLIRTRALGLNRAEALFRRGDYVVAPSLPSGIGFEAAGVVQAVGEDVTKVSVGQPVSVVPAASMTDYPLHGELVLAPARAVVAHSPRLSYEQAAALWMQYITAHGALVDLANARPGDTVLVSAASSSVGLAAIQIAKRAGALVIALTRVENKRERLMRAGADAVIVTSTEEVAPRVHAITNGVGARIIFDPVAGPGVANLIAAAADHGIVIVYGVLDNRALPLDFATVMSKHLTIRGYDLFEVTRDDARLASAVEAITAGVEAEDLIPVIDRTFALDQIVEAHEYLEANNQVGKVVITVT